MQLTKNKSEDCKADMDRYVLIVQDFDAKGQEAPSEILSNIKKLESCLEASPENLKKYFYLNNMCLSNLNRQYKDIVGTFGRLKVPKSWRQITGKPRNVFTEKIQKRSAKIYRKLIRKEYAKEIETEVFGFLDNLKEFIVIFTKHKFLSKNLKSEDIAKLHDIRIREYMADLEEKRVLIDNKIKLDNYEVLHRKLELKNGKHASVYEIINNPEASCYVQILNIQNANIFDTMEGVEKYIINNVKMF